MSTDTYKKITFRGLFKIVFSKFWIILLIAITMGIIVAVTLKFTVAPVYQASTTVYFITEKEKLSLSDMYASAYLAKDYASIIKSNTVVEEAFAASGVQHDYSEFIDNITVTVDTTNTRMLVIRVRDNDPYDAYKLTNALRDAASDYIERVVGNEALKVVENASVPESPVSPNTRNNLLLGGAFGGIIGLFIVLIRYVFSEKIMNEKDVKQCLNLSTLASIPLVESTKRRFRPKVGPVIIVAVLLMVDVTLAGMFVIQKKTEDSAGPHISFPGNTDYAELPEITEEELLKNVTAADDVEGDVSDSLIIEDMYTYDDLKVVLYTAKDGSNNITKKVRYIQVK